MKVKRLIIGTFIMIIGCHFVWAQSKNISEFEIQEKIHDFAKYKYDLSIQNLKLLELERKYISDSSQFSIVEQQLSFYKDSTELKERLVDLKKTVSQNQKSYNAQKTIVRNLENQCAKAKQFLLNALENKVILVEKESQVDYKRQKDSLCSSLSLLNHKLNDLQAQNDSLISILEKQKVENKKLSDEIANFSETHKYILNYGNAMLFRKYNARIDDIIRWLDAIPNEAKQKDIQEMLDEIDVMIKASTVPEQDLRVLVWEKIAPHLNNDDLLMENFRKVFAGIPDDVEWAKYNLVKHAETFIDNVSKEIKASDSRYDIIKDLLANYKGFNDEIYSVLVNINTDPDNNNSRMNPKVKDNYISKIKNTNYYKNYYTANFNIPFLNDIIDEAINLIQKSNGQTKIDLTPVLINIK